MQVKAQKKKLLRRIAWLEAKSKNITVIMNQDRLMYLGSLNEARKIYVELFGGSRRDYKRSS